MRGAFRRFKQALTKPLTSFIESHQQSREVETLPSHDLLFAKKMTSGFSLFTSKPSVVLEEHQKGLEIKFLKALERPQETIRVIRSA
eukprot:CAMPEP_0204908756 /NCGR_PEP_ID=MMETSP1397-20131031/7645_1 /ASSEMBLY_ACC=CAM_ASM_000891 /TAXON_ID=49980 /ORGANISM="Climacostomum Climacostomum virens, Strain Stock W-24" /LENGTH=86 /DNA_ID=CAMNT_0052078387 /DNA_START=1 /DNA_END=257 /DNA_ORIENTATION=+